MPPAQVRAFANAHPEEYFNESIRHDPKLRADEVAVLRKQATPTRYPLPPPLPLAVTPTPHPCPYPYPCPYPHPYP